MSSKSLESRIQGIVHALEQGSITRYIQLMVAIGLVVGIALLYLFVNFRGFAERQAMEQAQVARNIAAGNGFSTNVIRPLAMHQFRANGKEAPRVNIPETYHAPLHPMVNAVTLRLGQSHLAMSPGELIYAGERMIAATSLLLFIAALAVWYVVAWRLFDHRLAAIGTGLVVVCDLLWQFALSGLPQMLMLLLFGLAVLGLVFAAEAKEKGNMVGLWLGGSAAMFGLLALAHPLTIWMFAGTVVFVAFYFRPRLLAVLLVLVIFSIILAPWLMRNYAVTGNPAGLSLYAALDGVTFSEEGWMRQDTPPLSEVRPGAFRAKLQNNLLGQFNSLIRNLGWSLVAPVFFLSLLHLFKHKVRADLRWCVLLMWLGLVAGLTIFSPGDSAVSANQLHVLFVPVMIFYGLAMLFVLWARLPVDYPLIRGAFVAFLFLASAVPMVIQLLPGGKRPFQWPPYVPPFIAVLEQWYEPREIIASDMPWAVGWYANRKSLWLPVTPAALVRAHDYNEFGAPISGLYLTPVTGHLKFFSEIVRGEYKDWAPFILRSPNLQGFPMQVATALPMDNECIIFSDRARWSEEELTLGEEEKDEAAAGGEAAPEAAQE